MICVADRGGGRLPHGFRSYSTIRPKKKQTRFRFHARPLGGGARADEPADATTFRCCGSRLLLLNVLVGCFSMSTLGINPRLLYKKSFLHTKMRIEGKIYRAARHPAPKLQSPQSHLYLESTHDKSQNTACRCTSHELMILCLFSLLCRALLGSSHRRCPHGRRSRACTAFDCTL